jgi:hypothetical protein
VGLRIPKSLLLLASACAVMFTAGYGLFLIAPQNPIVPANAFDSVLLPNTVGVFPEPRDMFMFVGVVFLIPIVLAGLATLTARLDGELDDPKPIFLALVAVASAIVVARRSLLPPAGMLFSGFWQSAATLICIVAAGILARLSLDRLTRFLPWGLLGLFLISLLLIVSQRLWTPASLVYYAPFSSHYEALTSSAVRIATGGTCLADVIGQYGCYGEFVSPILKSLGSTVTVVTSVFCVLLIVAVGSAIAFSAVLIKHPLLIVSCGACIIIPATLNVVYYLNDPALQHYPFRFLFPSIALLGAVWFQRSPDKRRAAALGLFGGAAVTWNLESGLATLISLGAFVTIGNFTAKPWLDRKSRIKALQNAASYLLGCAAFISTFIVYLGIKSGSLIDIRNFIIFQEVFSVTGFAMIPIPAPPDLWTIHALFLFAVLVFCTLRTCSDGQRDRELELAAFVAVLGIGLFVYFVGRSHPLALKPIAWPSIFLFYFLLDKSIQSSKTRLAKSVFGLAMVISAALPAAFLVSVAPSVIKVARSTRNAPSEDNRAVLSDIDFIRSKTFPAEPVAIIAIDQGILYGHTGTTAAIEGPGVAEMIRRVDLERQIDGLLKRGPEKIFIGTNLDHAAETGLLGTSIPVDINRLRTVYPVVEMAPGGRLVYLRRRY